MAKIESGKSESSLAKKPINLATLSAKMGLPKEDVLKLFNKQAPKTATASAVSEEYEELPKDEKPAEDNLARLSALEEENARLKAIQEGARNKSDVLSSQIEEKDRVIAQLQKKLEDESARRVKESGKEKTLVNAMIEKKSGTTIAAEGCLSMPGISGEISRATKIKLTYQDYFGKKRMIEVEDLFARIIQHEMDHLNGILLIDHFKGVRREEMIANYSALKNKGM